MRDDEITGKILAAAFKIHTDLGPGLLESVYEVVLAHEVRKMGLAVERQVAIPIIYDGIQFEVGFRADLIVNDSIIVELKSVESLTKVRSKQLLTQLRLTKKRLGLLLNFHHFDSKMESSEWSKVRETSPTILPLSEPFLFLRDLCDLCVRLVPLHQP